MGPGQILEGETMKKSFLSKYVGRVLYWLNRSEPIVVNTNAHSIFSHFYCLRSYRPGGFDRLLYFENARKRVEQSGVQGGFIQADHGGRSRCTNEYPAPFRGSVRDSTQGKRRRCGAELPLSSGG